ncbi:hypothetical protein EJD97_005254 [Solanum chilense]|uniref:Uncharacterized protein n=1 Tax=Solanum chilense TaxID=4083 RepID=A0A6N2CDQ2_SOLCI|nr:hypothetical protein EJD97_005254 [Solanum chilense]
MIKVGSRVGSKFKVVFKSQGDASGTLSSLVSFFRVEVRYKVKFVNFSQVRSGSSFDWVLGLGSSSGVGRVWVVSQVSRSGPSLRSSVGSLSRG